MTDDRTAPAAADPAGTAPGGRGPATVARARTAVALVILGALLAPLALVAGWTRAEVTDTDRYLATVSGLAADPAVQRVVSAEVTRVVLDRLDAQALTTAALDGLGIDSLTPRAQAGLRALQAPLTAAVETFVRDTVTRIVGSDAFAAAWTQANRVAHAQLFAVLRSDPGSALELGADGELRLRLGPVVDEVRTQLVAAGFALAASIPAVDASVPLLTSPELVRARSAYALLDLLHTWLLWGAVGSLLLAVLIAPRRRVALLRVGVAVLVVTALWLGALAVLHAVLPAQLTGGVLRTTVVTHLADRLLGSLAAALRTLALAGVVVALVAFLLGGTRAARAVRGACVAGWGWVRARLTRQGARRGAEAG
ncbi:hypothetical protein AGMMS50218_05980 [Actinomycetota bacterium]|nr:hypothetical protein AGMMS50218_05980 [Actinomycetota bacterium]